MEILKIRSDLHRQLCLIRNLARLVNTFRFEMAFNRSDEKEKIIGLINNNDLESLEQWLRLQVDKSHEEMSMRELRDLAKDLGVRNYNNVSKAVLLIEIRRLECAKNSNQSIAQRNERISNPVREDY